MNSLADTLYSLVDVLDQLSIPYAVMGGIAVRAYGVPRPTYDVDATISIDRNALPRLFERLKAFDYSIPEVYETGWVDNVQGLNVIKLRRNFRNESLDVDLFLAESAFQREVMKRRIQIDVEGRKLWLVTPEDLVLFKVLAGRPRDLGDVFDVLFMQGPLDVEYLRRWGNALEITAELSRALDEKTE